MAKRFGILDRAKNTSNNRTKTSWKNNLSSILQVIPVTNYSRNNKTISDKISKEDARSNKEYKIIIPLGRFIRERTQSILPYPP